MHEALIARLDREMNAGWNDTKLFADLRAALASAPEAEPVAWVRRHPDGTLTTELVAHGAIEPVRKNSGAWVPLYASPASDPQAQVAATRQYYYRVNGCPANGSRNDNCICWHDEGTGPCKDGRPAHPDVPLTWRQKGGA